MKISHAEELLTYLQQTSAALTKLKGLCGDKNKTLKVKAFISTADVCIARLDASYKYAKAGGYNEMSVVIQREFYDYILEYWCNELTK